MRAWAKRSGHLLVEGSLEDLLSRLLARPDVTAGLPNFEGALDSALNEHEQAASSPDSDVSVKDERSDATEPGAADDRMRLITTRGGFALWTPLGPDQDQDPAALPMMVDVRVRRLDGRCALTLRRRMHPRTSANLASIITMGMVWAALALLSPQFWMALAFLPAFLVLPFMFVRHHQFAKTRQRRAWDALTETLAPLELPMHGDETPFRRLPAHQSPDHDGAQA